MNKKKCIFICPRLSTFVANDIAILSELFDVRTKQFSLSKNPLLFLVGFIRILVSGLFTIPTCKVVYIWFADYHSFLPVLIAKIFNKKSYLVIGGFDVARIRELKYGVFTRQFRGFCARYSMQNCTSCLTVSDYVTRKVRYIAPGAAHINIPNGVRFEGLESKTINENRENRILTVGVITSYRVFRIKGIDVFLKVAALMPGCTFQIIGANREDILRWNYQIPENVEITGKIDHESLVEYFQKTKIYCQFSIIETFCLALAEAMFFGCYPVISNNAALPEVLGDTGAKVNPGDPESIVKIISEKLKVFEVNLLARNRILANYTFELRKEKIHSLLKKN